MFNSEIFLENILKTLRKVINNPETSAKLKAASKKKLGQEAGTILGTKLGKKMNKIAGKAIYKSGYRGHQPYADIKRIQATDLENKMKKISNSIEKKYKKVDEDSFRKALHKKFGREVS